MPHDDTGSQLARVSKLLADYATYVDGRRAHEWAGLFASDGAMVVGARRIEGADALETFAATSPVGLHLTGVPGIEEVGDELVVRSSFVFVAADGSRLLAGSYTDRIVDDGSSAHFMERSVQMTVSTSLASPAP